MTPEHPVLTIVLPCYNEEESVPLAVAAFVELAPRLPPFELLFVNDGSKDRTLDVIRQLANRPGGWPFQIRVVNLSRNFGHQLALLAGMQNALGDACVSIDADLQDPPENIIEMVRLWREGCDVVLGQRSDRGTDTWFKRTTAQAFYAVMTRLTKGQFPEHVADFRLVDRKVLQVLCELKERSPYWRGLVAWAGYKRGIVRYARVARQVGVTKYPLRKMIAFAMDGVLGFSREPLRLVTALGFAMSASAFLYGMMYLLMRLMGKELVPGWTAIIGAVTLLGGIQLICIGILGEYIGRIYEQVLFRPQVLYYPAEEIAPLPGQSGTNP